MALPASPDSHALLDVSRGHLVTQVHHKLGKLLDIDNIFGVLRVCIDDLCASVGMTHRNRNVWDYPKDTLYIWRKMSFLLKGKIVKHCLDAVFQITLSIVQQQ